MGKHPNPTMPFANTKIMAALNSEVFPNKEIPKGEKRLILAASEIASGCNINEHTIKSQMKQDGAHDQVSNHILTHFKLAYGFSEAIRNECDQDRARQMVIDLCQPRVGIEYLRAKSAYRRFYEPLEDGSKKVDIVDGQSDQDVGNLGAAPRRQPDQDPGVYRLTRGKRYVINVCVWNREGHFYLFSREPNGDVFWVYPSSWGRVNHQKDSLLIPNNPPPAPVSTTSGCREMYGIVTASPLNVPDGFIDSEPTMIAPNDLSNIIGQLRRMGEAWSARRYDYIAD